MTIEERILRLERHFRSPAGARLVRVLDFTRGLQWSLRLGKEGELWQPSFSAPTIEGCLEKAERSVFGQQYEIDKDGK
jgi:hypothetical protein